MKIEENLIRYAVKAWNGVRPVPVVVTVECDEIGVAVHNALVLDQTGKTPTPYKAYCPRCRCLFPDQIKKVPPRPTCHCCSRPLVEPWHLTAFEKYLDTSFDAALSRCGALKFKPWFGKGYTDVNSERSDCGNHNRILIAGESHYTNRQDPKLRQLEIADWLDDDWSTREIFAWYPLLGRTNAGSSNNGGRSNIPTYDNLFEIVAGDPLVEDTSECLQKRVKLCRNIAFGNFFQRPFTYIPTWHERPSCTYANDDHMPAWEAILHVFSVSRPTLCLFLGVTAAKCFDYYMRQYQSQFNITRWNLMVQKTRINRCYPRSGTITMGGSTIALEFIRHPSMFVTCSAWREYLFKRVPWLKAEIDSILA